MNLFRLAYTLSRSFKLRALRMEIITLFHTNFEKLWKIKRNENESEKRSSLVYSATQYRNVKYLCCFLTSHFRYNGMRKNGTQAKALLNYTGAQLPFCTHTHTHIPETEKFQNHNFQNSKCARERIMHVPCINLKWKMENGKWEKQNAWWRKFI